ncbi:Conserved_hypothetical protein [Hexamita inflata]|uniref:RUN domain-containing protein n=1 Tax=Hexamita inflata TaxID=28002 RepID=A0AA86UJV8_9EUKA|nr:Conserved hypothetical protein [Hexamita inflata]
MKGFFAKKPAQSTQEQGGNSIQLLNNITQLFVEYNQTDKSDNQQLANLVNALASIFEHSLQPNQQPFTLISQVVKQFDDFPHKMQLEQLISSSLELNQAQTIKAVVRFLILTNYLPQFLSEFLQKSNQKLIEKTFTPSAIVRDQAIFPEIINKFQAETIECENVHFHPSITVQNEESQEIMMRAQMFVMQIPEQMIFSCDRTLASILGLLDEIMGHDELIQQIKCFIDLQTALDHIIKEKSCISAEIDIEIDSDILFETIEDINELQDMLIKAGAKIKPLQKIGDISFGLFQQKCLLYRYLLAHPLLLGLYFCGLGGLLEDKPLMHLNCQKIYKDYSTPITSANFCAQFGLMILNDVYTKKNIFNIHHLSAVAVLCQNELLASLLTNKDDGFLILNYKVFRINKQMQQNFNIVYYFQLVDILQNIFANATKKGNYLRTQLQLVCSNQLLDNVLEIQQELEPENLHDDEYYSVFIFKLLNRNILPQIFSLDFENVLQESFLADVECRKYIKRHLTIMQDLWTNKCPNKSQFEECPYIQKERMLVVILSLKQEADSIKNSGMDIIDGSFIGEMFESIEQNFQFFCTMLNEDLFSKLIQMLSKLYFYNYETDAIEYKQVFDQNPAPEFLDMMSTLEVIFQTKKFTVEQQKKTLPQFELFLSYGAISPVYQTLCTIITQELSEELFNIKNECQNIQEFAQVVMKRNLLHVLCNFIKASRFQLKRRFDMDAWILNQKCIDILSKFASENSLADVSFDDHTVERVEEIIEEEITEKSEELQEKQSFWDKLKKDKKEEPKEIPVVQPVQQPEPEESESDFECVVQEQEPVRNVEDIVQSLKKLPEREEKVEEIESEGSEHQDQVEKVQVVQKDAPRHKFRTLKNGNIFISQSHKKFQTQPYQLISHVANVAPFVNSYIMKDNVDVEVDLVKRDNADDSIITDTFIDMFIFIEKDKMEQQIEENKTVDHKEKHYPVRQKTAIAKQNDINWQESVFPSQLEEILEYIDSNQTEPFSAGTTLEEAKAARQEFAQYCYGCGDQINTRLFEQRDDPELSEDVETFLTQQPTYCEYQGKWLCVKCAQSRSYFKSIHPKSLSSGAVQVSGAALTEIYRFWTHSYINSASITEELSIIKQTLTSTYFMVQNCKLFKRVEQSFLMNSQNEVKNELLSLQQAQETQFMHCNWDGLIQLRAEIEKHAKQLKKYKGWFLNGNNQVEVGTIIEKQTTMLKCVVMHCFFCKECAGKFFMCPECRQYVSYEHNFEFLIKHASEALCCSKCIRPIHAKCAAKHNCTGNK